MIQILSTHEAGIRELQVSKTLSQKKKIRKGWVSDGELMKHVEGKWAGGGERKQKRSGVRQMLELPERPWVD